MPAPSSVAKSDPPRLADRFGTQSVGLFVADELVLGQVVLDRSIEIQRDIRRVTGDVREAGRVGVAFWLAARLHAIEKISDVERGRIAANLGDRSAGQ